MENAADALKIAFAILIFVIAITITFMMISIVKSTADTVFYYADNTNFREHTNSSATNREVSTTDVISVLYRYNKESIAVKIVLKDGNVYNFDKGNETILLEDLSNLNTDEQIEANLAKFITEKLPKNKKFMEEFVETPISGIYIEGSDGSEITVSSGSKKIYITYEEQ